MKFQAKLILSALGLCALPLAQAQSQPGGFEDFGRVVRVQPRVEQVRTPRQECRTDYVQAQAPQQQRSQAGTVIGGIAGALLGSQVGSGNGKVAAAAAGAIAGGLVGDHVDNDGRQQYGGQVQEQAVQRCRTVDAVENRTNGYDVTYDYRGHTYNTVLNRDPGQRVRLRVNVEADPYQ